MTKVIMYQAADGSLHKTLKEKEAKNVELRLKPAADAFVAGLDATDFNSDDRDQPCLYRDNVAEFIVKNADGLRKLLNDVLVVRRPRKVKKAAAQPAAAAGSEA